MRRLIAILVLVGGGWAPLAALDCPMVAPPEHPDAATHPRDPGHEPGGQERAPAAATAEAGHPGHDPAPPAPHHSGSDCPLMMTCGGAVLTTGRSAAIREAAPTTTAPAARRSLRLSTFFATADPPPPRLPV